MSESHVRDPLSASQNVGNWLGSRPCVRQTPLYRKYESGNAMKDILGMGHLNWEAPVERVERDRGGAAEFGPSHLAPQVHCGPAPEEARRCWSIMPDDHPEDLYAGGTDVYLDETDHTVVPALGRCLPFQGYGNPEYFEEFEDDEGRRHPGTDRGVVGRAESRMRHRSEEKRTKGSGKGTSQGGRPSQAGNRASSKGREPPRAGGLERSQSTSSLHGQKGRELKRTNSFSGGGGRPSVAFGSSISRNLTPPPRNKDSQDEERTQAPAGRRPTSSTSSTAAPGGPMRRSRSSSALHGNPRATAPASQGLRPSRGFGQTLQQQDKTAPERHQFTAASTSMKPRYSWASPCSTSAATSNAPSLTTSPSSVGTPGSLGQARRRQQPQQLQQEEERAPSQVRRASKPAPPPPKTTIPRARSCTDLGRAATNSAKDEPQKLSKSRFDAIQKASLFPNAAAAARSSPFAEAYARGALPCHIDHGTVKNRIAWDIGWKDILDRRDGLLALCAEGLSEVRHPHATIAKLAFNDLVQLGADVQVNPLDLKQIMVALRNVFLSARIPAPAGEPDTLIVALDALVRLTALVGPGLAPYVHLILPPIGKHVVSRPHAEAIAQAMQSLVEHGGPEAARAVKRSSVAGALALAGPR